MQLAKGLCPALAGTGEEATAHYSQFAAIRRDQRVSLVTESTGSFVLETRVPNAPCRINRTVPRQESRTDAEQRCGCSVRFMFFSGTLYANEYIWA
jgi:hypothetical protein